MTDDELLFKIMFQALFTFTFRPFCDFPGIPITVKIFDLHSQIPTISDSCGTRQNGCLRWSDDEL